MPGRITGAPAPVILTAAAAMAAWALTLSQGLGASVALSGASVAVVAYLLWRSSAAHGTHSYGPVLLPLAATAAVLPEMAVEIGLAVGGAGPSTGGSAEVALAGATGSSVALVGVAWPLAILLSRMRGAPAAGAEGIHTVSVWFLLLAALYNFTVFLKGFLSVLDALLLCLLFAGYVWSMSRTRVTSGPAGVVRSDPGGPGRPAPGSALRLAAVAVVMVGAAAAFGVTVAPLARSAGADGFGLVQWLVALASKSPLVLLVCTVAWRGSAHRAAPALLASHIAVLTLVMAAIPLAHFAAGAALGEPTSLALTDVQRSEVLLMAVGPVFLAVVLLGRGLPLRGGVALAVLFLAWAWVGALEPESQAVTARNLLAAVYVGVTGVVLVRDRSRVEKLLAALPRSGPRVGKAAPVGG